MGKFPAIPVLSCHDERRPIPLVHDIQVAIGPADEGFGDVVAPVGHGLDEGVFAVPRLEVYINIVPVKQKLDGLVISAPTSRKGNDIWPSQKKNCENVPYGICEGSCAEIRCKVRIDIVMG